MSWNVAGSKAHGHDENARRASKLVMEEKAAEFKCEGRQLTVLPNLPKIMRLNDGPHPHLGILATRVDRVNGLGRTGTPADELGPRRIKYGSRSLGLGPRRPNMGLIALSDNSAACLSAVRSTQPNSLP